jgi:hypothetical protein
MSPKPRKIPVKPPAVKPKKVKQPVVAPKVSYVYRKDAFDKVKLA